MPAKLAKQFTELVDRMKCKVGETRFGCPWGLKVEGLTEGLFNARLLGSIHSRYFSFIIYSISLKIQGPGREYLLALLRSGTTLQVKISELD